VYIEHNRDESPKEQQIVVVVIINIIIIIVVVIIVIIVVLYDLHAGYLKLYVPEANHVSRVYNVAVIP
jgi:hypothetical protein